MGGVSFVPRVSGRQDGTQSFVDERGERIGNEQLSALLEEDGRPQGTGQAGYTTLRRSALFKSLLQSVGNRTKFVEQLHRQQNSGSKNPSGALAKTFYSRGQSSATGLTAYQFTEELTKAFGAKVAERLQSKGVVMPLADQFVLQTGENRGTDVIQFEGKNGTFRDSNGEIIDRDGINAIGASGFGKKALAGGSTLARHAVLRYLLRTISEAKRRTDGRPNGILEAIRKFAD